MKPYDSQKSDIFAVGIILFMMVAQHKPFIQAKLNDKLYKFLTTNNEDKFWKFHCKNKPGGNSFFSEGIKDLITKMIS